MFGNFLHKLCTQFSAIFGRKTCASEANMLPYVIDKHRSCLKRELSPAEIEVQRQEAIQSRKKNLALAKHGNADKMCEVARCFLYGFDGLEINITEGLKWLECAAKNGSEPAQNELGRRYLEGCDVQQNFDLAFKWIRMAADGYEYPEMREAVGVMYFNGFGCKQDLRLAAQYFADIFEDHFEDIYEEGLKAEKACAYAEAKKLYLRAIRQGNMSAAIRLEKMIQDGLVQLVKPEFEGGFKFYNLRPC